MASTNYPDTIAASKGKMIAVEPQVSNIASLKPADSNKIIEVTCIANGGNIIQLALWHEMELTFNITEYEAMEKPVIIAVTFCWVRHFNGLQLSGTSTSHYYLNPNIPKTYHIKEQYQQLGNTIPISNIHNQRHQNLKEEKYRNRFPLATLLEVNPQNYQRTRFTSHERIYKISTQNKWYYERCTTCRNQVIPGDPIPTCKNHRPQPTSTYSYCFKAIIGDGSGTIPLTCFSNQVNSLIKDCNELLAELFDKNPYNLPSALKELEGTTHIFQFHFDTNNTSRKKDFVLHTVFTNTILSLPTPPIEHAEPKPISPELPKLVMLTETPSPALSRTVSNQFDPQLNITSPSQQSLTRLGQPEDPMRSQQEKEPADLPPLSTDMSTHIQVLQSTPPQIENPTEAHKGSKPSNPTTPSARKALFKDTSEIESSQVPKKAKHDK
uniref:Replication factor A C-terminal domain-containing protein n=1 Tax=Tanacetum cinerariifolium TaxID=118510 RepID=A0A6L2KM00_TANCI|nr:hypothetical protein [Tanacetum cinerariifolium]